MSEDDDWQNILDELTPALVLGDHVVASWEHGWIMVTWYGSKIKIPAQDITLNGMSVAETLQAELDACAPITPTEAYVNKGYVSYGKSGWEVHVPRNGRCKTVAWDESRYTLSRFTAPQPDDFLISTHGGILTVDNKTTCPASFLAQGKDYMTNVLEEHYTITDMTRVLVVHRPHVPVMLGHHDLIARMSAEMDAEHDILDIDELRPPRGRS